MNSYIKLVKALKTIPNTSIGLVTCLLLIASSSMLLAQNALDNAGLNSTTPATVAYSMRKLSSSYSGSAIQVLRSSDNTTMDIGFTAGGDLDATALTTFVGAGNGYVSVWYDQSGNGTNLTQTTQAYQPRIVNAGTIDLENSRPCIKFFGTMNSTNYNSLNLPAEITTTGHLSVINKFAGVYGFVLGHSSLYKWHMNGTPIALIHNSITPSIYNAKVWQNGASVLPTAAVWNTSLMINNIAPQTPSTDTNWDNIGRERSNYHTTSGGGYTELIVFSTQLNTYARIALANNQGAYYSIAINSNYLNRNGKIGASSSEYVNRNGALGGSGILKTGEGIAQASLSSPVTAPVSSITSATATSGVTIASDGGGTLTTGVCWNTSTNPTVSNFKTIDGGSAGTYTSNLTNLTGSTTYYVRAYATNYLGTIYGSEQSFTTLVPVAPTLAATTSITSITGITAASGGNVTIDGGAAITARGVCWSTVTNPTTADTKTTDAGTTGSFSSSITGLSLGTQYYVRAYATNSVGTTYGTELSFTTLSLPSLAATDNASAITSVSTSSGSTVTSDGGATVTARGVCWSTSTSPTTALSTKTTDGTGTGSFTSAITALAGSTTYYVRAYATTSVGTNYGTEVSFTTLAPVLPTLAATTSANTIRSTSAVSGGSVTSDGGAAVTVGVCWDTSPNPTTGNSITSAAGSLGSFSSTLTGLTLGTTYYVRSYAANSVGTVYGSEISFTAAYGIGESYGGGIIAYIFVSGDAGYVSGESHGLIAASADIGTARAWGCNGTLLPGAGGTAIGTGNQNTIDVVSGCATTTTPARLCSDLSLNGYTDWFLPSKDELSLVYASRASIGGFSVSYYWSSTETTATLAWARHFTTSTNVTQGKSNSYRIRPVRNF